MLYEFRIFVCCFYDKIFFKNEILNENIVRKYCFFCYGLNIYLCLFCFE